jgi:hypothetical protein
MIWLSGMPFSSMNTFANIFAVVRSRPFAAGFLLYQIIFFNVFLPGHTRGAITLDGRRASCCCCGSPDAGGSTGDSKRSPSPRDRENCAVCHFAARVMPTPIASFCPLKLGLLEVLPAPTPVLPITPDPIPTYQSRGPPSI